MKEAHITGLRNIANILQYWIDWNVEQRDKEGIDTTPDTHIYVVPTHWPSHGQIQNWIATLRGASDALENETPPGNGE